jgi:hypothetical protein
MSDFFKNLTLGHLLRNFFAGVIFVGSYLRAEGKSWPKSSDEMTLWAVVALTAGIVAYALHRSLINPLVESLYRAKWQKSKKDLTGKSGLSAREKEIRWTLGKNTFLEKRAAIAQHLSAWADYIHLLYCSVICLVAGAGLGWVNSELGTRALRVGICEWFKRGFGQIDIFLVVIGLVLLLAALVADFQRHRVEDWIYDWKE